MKQSDKNHNNVRCTNMKIKQEILELRLAKDLRLEKID